MQSKTISKLEQDVMDVVWECQECSVREVMKRMSRRKRLAYTTVATILQRLYLKGLVKRKEMKLSYLYSPKISQKAYTKSVARLFLQRFIRSFGDTAVASFAESIESIPKAKKDYLLRLLQEYDKRK